MDQKLNVKKGIRTAPRTTITEVKQYHSEEGEAQNMSPPPTVNLNCPPPTRYEGSSETSTMLDCICQLQLTLQQHVMTNSKQAEYHMSQNADLFTEMYKSRREETWILQQWPSQSLQDKSLRSVWIGLIG